MDLFELGKKVPKLGKNSSGFRGKMSKTTLSSTYAAVPEAQLLLELRNDSSGHIVDQRLHPLGKVLHDADVGAGCGHHGENEAASGEAEHLVVLVGDQRPPVALEAQPGALFVGGRRRRSELEPHHRVRGRQHRFVVVLWLAVGGLGLQDGDALEVGDDHGHQAGRLGQPSLDQLAKLFNHGFGFT